jgi:hypothetical protein
VLKYLIADCGVDVQVKDKNEDDALILAIRHKREATAIFLVNLNKFDLAV